MKTKLAMTLAILAGCFTVQGGAYASGELFFIEGNRAVTIWLVVINYPEACSSIPCSEADIFGAVPDNPTKAAVCYLTGQVVRLNRKAVFAGRLAEGQSFGCGFPQDPSPFGLKDAMRAEIHIIVREHGDALNNMMREEQVTTPGGGCNPDCIDTQFSTHVGADAVDGRSYSNMYRFDDGSRVSKANSAVIREKTGIRVVVDTRLDES